MNLYRIRTKTGALSFVSAGRLENVEGSLILRLSMTPDQAAACQADLKTETPVEIFAVQGDTIVLPAKSHKMRFRPEGFAVDAACLLL